MAYWIKRRGTDGVARRGRAPRSDFGSRGMEAITDAGFALASSQEEVALRRKLLFRLLRDFDFSRPIHSGEMITDPVGPNRVHTPHAAGR